MGFTSQEMFDRLEPQMGELAKGRPEIATIEGFRAWLHRTRLPLVNPGMYMAGMKPDNAPWGLHPHDILQHFTSVKSAKLIMGSACFKTVEQIYGDKPPSWAAEYPFYINSVYFTPVHNESAAEARDQAALSAYYAKNSPLNSSVLLIMRPGIYKDQPMRFGNMYHAFGPRPFATDGYEYDETGCTTGDIRFMSKGLLDHPEFAAKTAGREDLVHKTPCLRDEEDFLRFVESGFESSELGVVLLDGHCLSLRGHLIAVIAGPDGHDSTSVEDLRGMAEGLGAKFFVAT